MSNESRLNALDRATLDMERERLARLSPTDAARELLNARMTVRQRQKALGRASAAVRREYMRLRMAQDAPVRKARIARRRVTQAKANADWRAQRKQNTPETTPLPIAA